MRRALQDQAGTAIIMAVLCMLILGVFMISLMALADVESRVGLNHKAELQAMALADAALEHGRNVLRAAATDRNFNAFIGDATARQLGVPSTGIPLGSGRYWVRVDNDCAAPTGYTGSPPFVPPQVQDNGAGCQDTQDTNETAVLTAWAETTDATGRVIGRARIRMHYVLGSPWKHSCYDGDGVMCVDDAVGGCNNNPCIDPSDPDNPNGPATGPLPLPNDIRCGTSQMTQDDVPADVWARMSPTQPCFIYPYYKWAISTPAPSRRTCQAVTSGGYANGPDPCNSSGTLGWNRLDSTCTATPSKCHGMVFFGPGNSPSSLATGADTSFGTNSNDTAGCMGTQNQDSARGCYDGSTASSSVVVYVMGKATIKNNVEINGTLVLHGDAQGGPSHKDFGMSGTSRIVTHKCPPSAPSPCGYPLALLGYNPNEPAPVTSGQTIELDISNNTSFISGLIYTGGTADFSPLTVDGGLIGWNVQVNNASFRLTYNATYGNDAPPPAFNTPTAATTVVRSPSTWVHCTDYANDFAGPTPCQ